MNRPEPIRVGVRKRPRRALQLWYRCPLTGRIVTRSASTDNWTEAHRKAEQWQMELQGQTVTATNPSWDEFRRRFEDEFLAHKPKNTRISYIGALNNWESHIGAVKALELITPSLVSQFSAAFGKTVETTTVASNLRHIRSALRWAESMELIRRAPRIVLPKSNRRRLARSRAVTQEEFGRMRVAVESLRPDVEVAAWQRLLDVLWFSGLRINEALVLSWDAPPIMVDLDGGRYPRLVIWAEGQKSRDDEVSIIAPDFADWLRQTPPGERSGPVAHSLADFSRSAASHVMSATGKAAQIVTGKNKHASAHDIRRAFGQRWAKVVRPLTLQKMMRHAAIQTTLAYYVDLDSEDVGAELWGPLAVQSDVHQPDRSVRTNQTNTP